MHATRVRAICCDSFTSYWKEDVDNSRLQTGHSSFRFITSCRHDSQNLSEIKHLSDFSPTHSLKTGLVQVPVSTFRELWRLKDLAAHGTQQPPIDLIFHPRWYYAQAAHPLHSPAAPAMSRISLSDREREFIVRGIVEGIRADGRTCSDYRHFQLCTDAVSNTSGSAEIQLVSTHLHTHTHVYTKT